MMPPTNMPPLPPVPRDAQTATFSEIMPIRSRKISMVKSPVLWVTFCAGLISVAGFGLNMSFISQADPQKQLQAFALIGAVSTFALLVAITSGFYYYAKPNKPFWVCILVAALTGLLLISPVFQALAFVTIKILPGDFSLEHPTLIGAFFGPGLREELLKAIPALLGALLTFAAISNPALLARGWVRNLRVAGPLDGVMYGIFAGAGFTFMETGFQYVTDQVSFVTEHGGSVQLGEASGLALLVPRVIEGLTGHSGYSAIFGYFIGLSVIRPKSKWMLLGIGYGLAALLHGLWDGFDEGVPTMVAWSSLTGLMAIGVLLKARQLETVITGRAVETQGSILVERPIPAMPVGMVPGGYQPAMAGMPQPAPYVPPRPATPPVYTPPPIPPAGAQPPPVYTPPVAQPGAPAAAPGALVIDIGGLKLPVRADVSLDLGAEPALGERGRGVRGVIVAHPTRAGVFGLKNAGDAPWTAHLRDGTTQAIDGDKNIRLAPGVSIEFAPGLTGSVQPAG